MAKKILKKEDNLKISTKLFKTTTSKYQFKVFLNFKDKFPVSYQTKIFIHLKVHTHFFRGKSSH